MIEPTYSIWFHDCYIPSPGQKAYVHMDNLNKPEFTVPLANGCTYLLKSDGTIASKDDACDMHFWLYQKKVDGVMKYDLYSKISMTPSDLLEIQTGRHLFDPNCDVVGTYPLFISGSTYQWSFVKQWYIPKFGAGIQYNNNLIVHWSNDTRQGLIGPDFSISKLYIDLYFYQFFNFHTKTGNSATDARVDKILAGDLYPHITRYRRGDGSESVPIQ